MVVASKGQKELTYLTRCVNRDMSNNEIVCWGDGPAAMGCALPVYI